MTDYHSTSKIFKRENVLKTLYQYLTGVVQRERVTSNAQDERRTDVNIVEHILREHLTELLMRKMSLKIQLKKLKYLLKTFKE